MTYAGRCFRYLTDLDYAVLNVLIERRRTTAEVVRALSGYDPDDVRESVRRLRRSDMIQRTGSDGHHSAVWGVIA